MFNVHFQCCSVLIVVGVPSVGSIGERSVRMKVSSIIPLLTGQSPPVIAPPPGTQHLETTDRYGRICVLPRVANVDHYDYIFFGLSIVNCHK